QNLAKSRKKGDAKEEEIAKGEEQQETIKQVLSNMQSDIAYTNRDAFIDLIKDAFKDTDVNLKAPLIKAIWTALSERDETAEPCMKSKNKIEPDSELRDTEIIPLSENIEEYFEREVLPHVPDAWIDEDKTRIGYEVPFTRYFYQYTKLRRWSEGRADIEDLEARIVEKLRKVIE